ncbi:hypothetical protein D918_06784 [Trichuris suis]|nr:hypothetical protein D918_06784 [Trichuris suis]
MVKEKWGKVENVSKSDRMAKSSDKKRRLRRKDLVPSYVCKVPKTTSAMNDFDRIHDEISQLLRYDVELIATVRATQALISEAFAFMKKPDGDTVSEGRKATAEGATTK